MNYSIFLHDVLFNKEWAKALMNMPDAEAGILIKLFSKYIVDGFLTEEDMNVLDADNRTILKRILQSTDRKSEKRYKKLFENGIIIQNQELTRKEENKPCLSIKPEAKTEPK